MSPCLTDSVTGYAGKRACLLCKGVYHMKIKNALTAALAAMAMLTAGCIGGGNSANKMDTPKEGLAELQVSAAASLNRQR